MNKTIVKILMSGIIVGPLGFCMLADDSDANPPAGPASGCADPLGADAAAPADEFQSHMVRLQKLLKLHPQFEPEVVRISGLLHINDPQTLLDLLSLYPLEVAIPLSHRPNRGEDIVARSQDGKKSVGSGIVVAAASKLLEAIPVKTDSKSAVVMNELQLLDTSRQEAITAEKPATILGRLGKMAGGIFKRGKTRVAEVFSRDTVLSRVQTFEANVTEDVTETMQETERILDVVDDIDMSIVTIRANAAAALMARQKWHTVEIPHYKKQNYDGFIDDSAYGTIIENAGQLDKIIHDLIIMESSFAQMRQMAQDKAKDSRTLVLQYQRILSQTVPTTVSLMTLYFTGQNQAQRAAFISGVRDFTNKLAAENVKTHAAVGLKIAEEAERGMLDARTVEDGFKVLITLFGERFKIATTAANKRATDGLRVRGQLLEFLGASRNADSAALQLKLGNPPKTALPSSPAAKSNPVVALPIAAEGPPTTGPK